jgi:hypothetical protein
MHLIRLHNDAIFIDEHDLVRCQMRLLQRDPAESLQNIRSLCSAFSYCLSILDSVYVWHGCGSRKREREAALIYAQNLAGDMKSVTELVEGVSDDDEKFWMMLGEPEYANADYWKWRVDVSSPDPRIWRVDADTKEVVCAQASHYN